MDCVEKVCDCWILVVVVVCGCGFEWEVYLDVGCVEVVVDELVVVCECVVDMVEM